MGERLAFVTPQYLVLAASTWCYGTMVVSLGLLGGPWGKSDPSGPFSPSHGQQYFRPTPLASDIDLRCQHRRPAFFSRLLPELRIAAFYF